MIPTRRRYRPWLLAVGMIIVAAAWWTFPRPGDPRPLLREVPGMRDLPASVRAVECESWSFADVQAKCAFTVDAADFPRLLRGWPFAQKSCGGPDSWGVTGGGPRVGPRFPVDVCYQAKPPEFKHGGRVLLAADSGRTRVIADLYIE